MNTLIITPQNASQQNKIKELAKALGLSVGILDNEDLEDAAMLKAITAVENDTETVSLSSFLEKLRS